MNVEPEPPDRPDRHSPGDDRTQALDVSAEEALRLEREAAAIRGRAPGIPGYEIVRELGSGGMGTVYLALQKKLRRPVALKVLNPAATTSARARARFLGEARALARFQHPHLVPVFDVVEADGICAFAMEWIDGRSLAELIEVVRSDDVSGGDVIARRLGSREGEFPFEGTLQFFCHAVLAAARALALVHRDGFLHRDVKPSNILVRKNGTALLSDFGLVRDPEQSLQTQTGAFLGTFAYAPPEQLRGDHERVDVRSDVFSLGATLYECITLQRPFGAALAEQSLHQRETGAFIAPRRLNKRLPKDLATIASKALDPDPARRYATADEFAEDLERFLTLRPIVARPAGWTRRTILLARRHATISTVIGTGLIVGGALWASGLLAGKRADPHGTVRFSSMEPDIKIEKKSGTAQAPHWELVQLKPDGSVDLPLGPADLRVRRKNFFPYHVPSIENVREGETTQLDIKTLKIEQSSFRVGPPGVAPVIVDVGLQKKLVILELWGRTVAVDPFSGRPADEHYSVPAKAPLELCSQGSGHQAILARFQSEQRELGAWEIGINDPMWIEDEHQGPGAILQVALVRDMDHDGVRELVAVRGNGDLDLIQGASGCGRETPIDNFAPVIWKMIASCELANRSPLALLLGHTGEIDQLFIVDLESKQRICSCRVPDGTDSVVPVVQPDGALRVVLAGSAGCYLMDPSARGNVVTLAGRGAAATTLRGSETGDVGVVVATATDLSLFDATGSQTWSERIDVTPLLFVVSGNLDGEPGDEVVVASTDGIVNAFSGVTGEVRWTFETRGAIAFPPIIDDIDDDGFGDVAVLSADEYFYVLAGSEHYRTWTADIGWPLGGKPVFVPSEHGAGTVIIAGAGVKPRTPPYERGMPGPSIHALNAKTGVENWKRGAECAFFVSPDVVDLDGDGSVEVLAQDRARRLVSFRVTDGLARVIRRMDGEEAGLDAPPPRVIDVGDRKEVVVCVGGNSGTQDRVEAFDSNSGARLWSTPAGDECDIYCMEPGKLGASQRLMIVCGSENKGIVILDAKTGEIANRLLQGDRVHGSVLVADANGDGFSDVIVGVQRRDAAHNPIKVYALVVFDGRTLQQLWSMPVSEGIDAQPAVGDVDEDGHPDVLAADFSGNVHAFRGVDGSLLWNWRLASTESIYSTPVIADVDGDGHQDVVVGTKGTKIRKTAILDARSGALKREIAASEDVWGTALVANIDGDKDGRLEIVIGDDGGTLSAFPGRVGRP